MFKYLTMENYSEQEIKEIATTLIDGIKSTEIYHRFLLPLVGINLKKVRYSSFSKIRYSKDGKFVYLLPIKNMPTKDIEQVVELNRNYRYTINYQEKEWYVFTVPSDSWSDVNLIFNGDFSNVTDKSKELIREYSGLPYKSKKSKNVITHLYLYLLNKDITVPRSILAEFFGVPLSSVPLKAAAPLHDDSEAFM